MNLKPVTKLDKRNKTTSKKFDDDVMLENCDMIVIFRSSPEAGFRKESAKVMFSVIVTFCFTKTENI